jgi:hypothetical protein
MTTTELQSGKWLRVTCNSTHTAICERQKGIKIKSLFLIIKFVDLKSNYEFDSYKPTIKQFVL